MGGSGPFMMAAASHWKIKIGSSRIETRFLGLRPGARRHEVSCTADVTFPDELDSGVCVCDSGEETPPCTSCSTDALSESAGCTRCAPPNKLFVNLDAITRGVADASSGHLNAGARGVKGVNRDSTDFFVVGVGASRVFDPPATVGVGTGSKSRGKRPRTIFFPVTDMGAANFSGHLNTEFLSRAPGRWIGIAGVPRGETTAGSSCTAAGVAEGCSEAE